MQSCQLPLHIENQHSMQVTITRLPIPPNRLGLFAKESVLITNPVKVKIKTDKEGDLYFSNDTTLNDFSRIADPKTAAKGGAIGKLSTLGIKLSGLLATAGLLTVALGFAPQTSISNIISGFFLLMKKL